MTASDECPRDGLYQAYASERPARGDDESGAVIYRGDICPMVPPQGVGLALDIGCGQGQLVWLFLADDYDADGVDLTPEQMSLARAARIHRVGRQSPGHSQGTD
jgi:SAM-dependent methyltransferase